MKSWEAGLLCIIPLQRMNKDTVQENTSTRTDADQESCDNDGEATHRRKTPEDSHSGKKELFTALDSYMDSLPCWIFILQGFLQDCSRKEQISHQNCGDKIFSELFFFILEFQII